MTLIPLDQIAKKYDLSISFENILGKECLVVRDGTSNDLLAKGSIQAGLDTSRDRLIRGIISNAASKKQTILATSFGTFAGPLGTKVEEISILGKQCLRVTDIFGGKYNGVIQAGDEARRKRLIEDVLIAGGFKRIQPDAFLAV